MDPITQQQALAAAGAAGGEGLYVDDVFSTYLYEGNGSTQTITNGIDLSGEGGLIWFKRRDAVGNNTLTDTVDNKRLITDNTNAQNSNALVSSFNSDGFSLNTSLTPNQSGSDYCSWTFRKAPGFFDVVTYTGTGANRSIAHSLGSVPGCILIKCLSRSGDDWIVYHRSLGNTKFLNLNQTYAASTDPAAWNSSTPTSTVFYLGDKGQVNDLNQSYVAYIFAHDDQSFGEDEDESIIKCGTFTGTGSVNVGWEPQWLLIKPQTLTYNWEVYDNMRGTPGPGNSASIALKPNSSNAELGQSGIKFEPKGFYQSTFGSGAPCIYIAIRRPHKPPEAGTDVFAVDTLDGTTKPGWTSGFVVDWKFQKTVNTTGDWETLERITGGKLFLARNDAEVTPGTNETLDYNNGWGNYSAVNSVNYSWMFRRAPGFFDMVAYSGTGAVQNVNHNLEAVPELMIVKSRSLGNWNVYSSATGATKYLNLNGTIAAATSSSRWNDTTPTSSIFTAGTTLSISGENFIAYLFATLPGISKVGSYTGNGATATIDVDCGFTAGARFVLIKRTDFNSDWYVWDTARGINSGTESILDLNTTDVENIASDWIDPLNSGFQITTGGSTINASGGTYIFLAIA